jgi:L-ascorbate metabolism protein UlaG (beta-lactamase superfamily)
MTLNWYGEGCFRLESRGATIAIDPFESGLGLTAPRFAASIVLNTSAPIIKPYVSQKTSDVHAIGGPGEYEIQGIMIHGVAVGETIAYTVTTEDLTIAFFGGLVSADIDASALELLGTADIVCVPVGGTPYLDAAAAVALIKKLEPKIIIPSFYSVPGLKRTSDSLARFEKTLGQHPEAQEKLTVKAKELAWEGTKLVVLAS